MTLLAADAMAFDPVHHIPCRKGGALGSLLIIGDHASNHVPDEITLGLAPQIMETHRAVDLGTASISALMAQKFGCGVANATTSRLVVDLNRHRHDPEVIPYASDTVTIAGNQINDMARELRLQTYYDSYHRRIGQIVADMQPKLLIFLHSFTPQLDSQSHETRPWHIGVMYDEDERAGLAALQYFQQRDIPVGDQLPYSGKIYNSSIARHGGNTGIANIGIEIRQDLIADDSQCAAMSDIIGEMADIVLSHLLEA